MRTQVVVTSLITSYLKNLNVHSKVKIFEIDCNGFRGLIKSVNNESCTFVMEYL